MNEFNQVANIKVFGIGGGGSNAVNRMVADGVKGVTFYIANTDVQVMKNSDCENKIVLGRERRRDWVPAAIRKWAARQPRKRRMRSVRPSREATWSS